MRSVVVMIVVLVGLSGCGPSASEACLDAFDAKSVCAMASGVAYSEEDVTATCEALSAEDDAVWACESAVYEAADCSSAEGFEQALADAGAC